MTDRPGVLSQSSASTRIQDLRTLGHYEIVAPLGAGGMGEVYRARDLKLDRPVAIKILPSDGPGDGDSGRRLLREARAASALNHPGIVTVYSVEEVDRIYFLVMELIEGETWQARTARGSLGVEEMLELGGQVGEALEAAHRAGIVHRDIKPSNIVILPGGRAKVLDFGIAKRLRSGPPSSETATATVEGGLVGTVAYMSPEQTRGETLDGRSDVFSLGCVLYEGLTGRRPFGGPSVLHVLHAISTEAPIPASLLRPSLPRGVDEVLARALAKDRALRYSGAEFAEALRQVNRGEGTAAEPPRALPARDRGPNNLPDLLTSFVGREREATEVRRLLAQSRLVTLTGSGGCGKTRLALHAAEGLLGVTPQGVWLVELAPLTDPGLIPQAVASALGLRETTGRSLEEAILEFLAGRSLLLILDNCEHVRSACATFAERLLRAGPLLRILATSREPLGLAGEVSWRVPSLSLPDRSSPGSFQDMIHCESVRLFLERARTALPSFAATESTVSTAAEICARLDGIPLAIELAAARVRVLPVAQILIRLQDRFRLLTGGDERALPRHKTLRAALDWSYDLLTIPERSLLERMSVFAGGASLEAAESVCAGSGVEEEEVLDLISRLVDKSLLVASEGGGGTARYGMLETLRQYSGEKLDRTGARPELLDRHSRYFEHLAREAEPELVGPQQREWLDRLADDHDNLRQSIQRAVDSGDARGALRLGGALWRFWWVRGAWGEGKRRLDSILAIPSGAGLAGDRANALVGCGRLTYELGDYGRARSLHAEALALRRDLGDRAGMAMSLVNLGLVMHAQGEYGAAQTYYEESLELQIEVGNQRGIAVTYNNLARLQYEQGSFERARTLYERSLELRTRLGDAMGIAISLNGLGNVALLVGDLEQARAYQEQCLAIYRGEGASQGVSDSLICLGLVACDQGDFQTARAHLSESLHRQRELGDRFGGCVTLDAFACLAAAEEMPERALRLAGAVEALRRAHGVPRPPAEKARFDGYVERARQALDPGRASRAWCEGEALGWERATVLALDEAAS